MEVSQPDRCYVYVGVVDLPPGLSALVGKLEENTLYLFGNRRRNLLKFLSVDKLGTWVGTRRLHHNRFAWPEDPRGRQKLTAEGLAAYLSEAM